MDKKQVKQEEKASSTKERILEQAVKDFGRYGYHGTTTRTIANNVGINISALHYHWGDKQDLYEAAVIYVNKQIAKTHKQLGEQIRELPAEEKIKKSVNTMSDMLFSKTEYASLILFDSLLDTKEGVDMSDSIKESTMRNYMTIAKEFYGDDAPSKQSMLDLIAVIEMSYYLFTAQKYFCKLLDIDRDEYIDMVNILMEKIYRIPLIND